MQDVTTRECSDVAHVEAVGVTEYLDTVQMEYKHHCDQRTLKQQQQVRMNTTVLIFILFIITGLCKRRESEEAKTSLQRLRLISFYLFVFIVFTKTIFVIVPDILYQYFVSYQFIYLCIYIYLNIIRNKFCFRNQRTLQ